MPRFKTFKDNTLSKKYFSALVDRYEVSGVAKIIQKEAQQVWRLKQGWRGSLPSPKVIKNLSRFFNEPVESIKKKLFVSEKNEEQTVAYPNIRKAVSEAAFYSDQFHQIFFSMEFTKEEEDFITFYFLVKSGEKFMFEKSIFEVLPIEKRQEAIEACEKDPNLSKSFKQVLGMWYRKNGRYFFQNHSSQSTGIIFLNSFKELLKAVEKRKTFTRQLEKITTVFKDGDLFLESVT